MSDLHHIHIDLPPSKGAILGFLMTAGAKIVTEVENTSTYLPSKDAMIDAFILGFIGAFGGLVLSLAVKLIKYIWDNRQSIKQRWQAEESQLGKLLKGKIAKILGIVGMIGGLATESNFMSIQQYLPPVIYKAIVLCAAISFFVGKFTKQDECKEEGKGQASQQGS